MIAKPQKQPTPPSFVTEIPLRVSQSEEVVLLSRLEAGRQLYNACLGEIMRRLNLVKQSKLYQKAKRLPRTDEYKKERNRLYSEARIAHGYSEYALHAYATSIRNSWIEKHIDANTAQKLATRAFKAAERVMYGQAKKVRFKGKNQLDSLEGKSNSTGIRWKDEQVIWGNLKLQPLIDSYDPVIIHGLSSRVKYVRLVRRKIGDRNRFYAQLVCEGIPFQKPCNPIGQGTVGLDLGPSTMACFTGSEARLQLFAVELDTSNKKIRRLQRKRDRQQRANNPENYDEKGRIKKGKKRWKKSNRQRQTEAQLAQIQRKAAAHRKSLHGRLVNELLRLGNEFKLEKVSYKAWQKIFGKSIGHRAPGSFVVHLKRKAASAGGSVLEFSTHKTALSQTCQCGKKQKKTLSQRVHQCECGVIAQRDLYSAFLASFVDAESELLQAERANLAWSGAEQLLRAAWQQASKTNQRLGGFVPSSFGVFPEAVLGNGSEAELVVREDKRIGAKSLDVVAARRELGRGVSINLSEPPGF